MAQMALAIGLHELAPADRRQTRSGRRGTPAVSHHQRQQLLSASHCTDGRTGSPVLVFESIAPAARRQRQSGRRGRPAVRKTPAPAAVSAGRTVRPAARQRPPCLWEYMIQSVIDTAVDRQLHARVEQLMRLRRSSTPANQRVIHCWTIAACQTAACHLRMWVAVCQLVWIPPQRHPHLRESSSEESPAAQEANMHHCTCRTCSTAIPRARLRESLLLAVCGWPWRA